MKKTFTLLSLLAIAGLGFAQAPTTGAPDPTADAAYVISLFSGVYTDVAVNTWRTDWSGGQLTDTTIDGNDMKRYSAMGVAGIETVGGNLIDASVMTHFNIDFWSANATVFKIKLVDFGADGVYSPANQGGDDSEHEYVFNTKDNPSEWISYHIPLSFFSGLTGTAHMAQYILVAEPFGSAEIYIDNVYFSNNGPMAEPTTAAADPTDDAADVISMFSDMYTDVTVDTWRTPWSAATLEDIMIGSNNVKKYSGVDVIGIEAVGANLIDASEMDYFNVDIWSADFSKFKIKLVDWGNDGAYDGGDDTEHELTFDNPETGKWVKYRIPMSDFTGLTNRDKLAQFILVAETRGIPTVYVDNMYFSKEVTGNVETASLNGIRMFPNPAQSVLNIDLQNATSDISSVEIRDLQGRVVMTRNIENDLQHSVDISLISSGIYVAILKGPEANFTQKIIIE